MEANPAVARLVGVAVKRLKLDPGPGLARRLGDLMWEKHPEWRPNHHNDAQKKAERLIKGTTDARASSLIPVLIEARLLDAAAASAWLAAEVRSEAESAETRARQAAPAAPLRGKRASGRTRR